MNKRYLDLMEKILSAYTNERIIRFFDEVKEQGLKDQGFARLTSNIGILLAHGRRMDLRAIFLEMMEFCCKTIPSVKAANDFSVREIVCCIAELENSNVVEKKAVARWKAYFATIDPTTCYTRFAQTPTDSVRNWALFTGLSEFFRQKMGLCDSSEFIDIQIASQLQWIDENGMYMDNADTEVYQPIVYDIVPRGLFALLLHAGYRGKYYEEIDSLLKRAGMKTLYMQSVLGEAPFGGRSNQFVHNEAWLAVIFEYEATRYKKEKNDYLAGKFKSATLRALDSVELWLTKTPISHIKNRFSTDTKYGCETYGGFNKYMISAASFLYMASLICDDSIVPIKEIEAPVVWSTSKYFHKTFVKTDEYSLEFDTNADPHYDGSGLGRIHKKGAPSAICISMPFTKAPYYYCGNWKNETEIFFPPTGRQINASQFSICPALRSENGEWLYGADSQTKYALIESTVKDTQVRVAFQCGFVDGTQVQFSSVVDECVVVEVEHNEDKEVGIALPVFDFDGETHTKIRETGDKIQVEYDGWACEYSSNSISELKAYFANRNGIYKGYIATGKGKVSVWIKIYPLQK